MCKKSLIEGTDHFILYFFNLFYVTTYYFVTLFLNLFCKWELWLFGNLRYRPNEVLCNQQNFKFSFRLLRESLWFSSWSSSNKPYLSLWSLRWQCCICKFIKFLKLCIYSTVIMTVQMNHFNILINKIFMYVSVWKFYGKDSN